MPTTRGEKIQVLVQGVLLEAFVSSPEDPGESLFIARLAGVLDFTAGLDLADEGKVWFRSNWSALKAVR